jgi:Kef-type K+ transport system membrane component KefB
MSKFLAIVLGVVMMNAVIMSVIMLSVVAPIDSSKNSFSVLLSTFVLMAFLGCAIKYFTVALLPYSNKLECLPL